MDIKKKHEEYVAFISHVCNVGYVWTCLNTDKYYKYILVFLNEAVLNWNFKVKTSVKNSLVLVISRISNRKKIRLNVHHLCVHFEAFHSTYYIISNFLLPSILKPVRLKHFLIYFRFRGDGVEFFISCHQFQSICELHTVFIFLCLLLLGLYKTCLHPLLSIINKLINTSFNV